jgi:hypothetical protein
MKAIDVFEKLFCMSQSYYYGLKHNDPKNKIPGTLLNPLSDEERKILADLKPEDISNLDSIPRDIKVH